MKHLQSVKHQRSFLDRRSDQDRRQRYNIDIVEALGCDRRGSHHLERRTRSEKRSDWSRVSQWVSVCIPALSA